jgi:transcriptional regulator with XRE-family HTH domain
MEIKIPKHKYDIIQKYTIGLFRDATLEFYGIKTAKIKELINTEIPVIEVRDKDTDFVFLLEDNTYQHFEFESSYKKSNLIRFATYDLYLHERDGRQVNTVIIYSADVPKDAPESLKIGSLEYEPDIIMLCDYDGNTIYAKLEAKLRAGKELTDADMLNLLFLPLMRSTVSKYELAKKSIELAKTIEDDRKRDICIASTVAFMEKYLTEDEQKRILEVIRMTKIVDMIITDEMLEVAKKAIRKGLSLEDIADLTNLDINIIQEIQENQESDDISKQTGT